MNAAFATSTRVKLNARKIDSLISLGMSRFEDAGIHVSPSKMSKLVRESARKFGYELAERIVLGYFESAELLQWESYKRALAGGR